MEAEIRTALAEDLAILMRLHDRELDADTLAGLQQAGFPGGLALLPADAAAQAAYAGMAQSLAELVGTPAELDRLAADYAALYLNNRFSTAPYESVWLHEEHLTCQQPMFELRALYAAAGLQVADWRQRHDDHLVLQLHYLQHQLAGAPPGKLAQFIDEHLGFWLPEWAQRVCQFADTAFYAALAELTLVWLIRLRSLLAELADCPIPPRAEIEQRIQSKLGQERAEVAPLKFMPGAAGPSW